MRRADDGKGQLMFHTGLYGGGYRAAEVPESQSHA
jgi:hypothetical protein